MTATNISMSVTPTSDPAEAKLPRHDTSSSELHLDLETYLEKSDSETKDSETKDSETYLEKLCSETKDLETYLRLEKSDCESKIQAQTVTEETKELETIMPDSYALDSDLEDSEDYADTWEHHRRRGGGATKRTLKFDCVSSDDESLTEEYDNLMPPLQSSSSDSSESDSESQQLRRRDCRSQTQSLDATSIGRKVKPPRIVKSPDKKRRRRPQAKERGVVLEPAPWTRSPLPPGDISLMAATRFFARSGNKYVVGGPGSSSQDVISVTCPPYKARGQNINIDRFQVRLGHRRQGYGRKAMAALVKLYTGVQAISLIVTAPTAQGKAFYKKMGFTKNDMGDWVLKLRGRDVEDSINNYQTEFKTPPPQGLSSSKRQTSTSNSKELQSDYFSITGKGDWRKLRCRTMGRIYQVPSTRVVKALEKLNPQKISVDLLRPGNKTVCMCARKCASLVTVSDVLDARAEYFSKRTEVEGSNFLISQLRTLSTRDKETGKLKYTHKAAGREVCSQFYAAFIGVSKSKLTKCRNVVANGGVSSVHGNWGRVRVDKATQATICVAFWTHFFETAQRPNSDTRLMPADQSTKHIYETIFPVWYQNMGSTEAETGTQERKYQDEDLPSLSVFRKARKNPRFRDVKNRPKHYHARCATCAELQARRLAGFKSGWYEDLFKAAQEAHSNEVKAWRDHEEYVKNAVSRAPHNRQLFLYDDTSCLELPHFTNRSIKNLGRSRVSVIPFYIGDYGSNDAAYIYTVKHRFRKGANRLCTTLFHAIRRSKFRKTDTNTHLARHLILQADNYCENKNSDVLLFASELVWRGWYDTIDFEFGPVGHTHNGADAVHRIHNVVCGSFVSMTLGDFIAKFEYSFKKEGSIPAACLLDVQYDWKKRYAVAGVSARLAGFTNTTSDGATVSLFRIRRRPNATSAHVEVVWKRDTMDPAWRGADSEVGTPGFIMLRKLPKGAPCAIPISKTKMEKKYITELTGKKMRKIVRGQACDRATADAVMNWLSKAARTGQVCDEASDVEPATNDDAEWGPLVNVGIPGMKKNCHAIKRQTEAEFWKLPKAVEEDMQSRVLLLRDIRESQLQLPNVRYARNATGKRSSTMASQGTSTSASSKEPGTSTSTSTGASTGAMASASSSSSSNDHDNDWGAHFNQCKDGAMAIQSMQWGDGRMGISIVQVLLIHSNNMYSFSFWPMYDYANTSSLQN